MSKIDLRTGFNLFSGTYSHRLISPIVINNSIVSYEESFYNTETGLFIPERSYDYIILSILPNNQLTCYNSIKYAIELAKYSFLNKRAVSCFSNCVASIEAIMCTEEYYKAGDWFRYYQINEDESITDLNGTDTEGISNKIKLFEPIVEANQRLIFEGIVNY